VEKKKGGTRSAACPRKSRRESKKRGPDLRKMASRKIRKGSVTGEKKWGVGKKKTKSEQLLVITNRGVPSRKETSWQSKTWGASKRQEEYTRRTFRGKKKRKGENASRKLPVSGIDVTAGERRSSREAFKVARGVERPI